MAFAIRLWTPKKSPFTRLLNTRKEAFKQLMTYYLNEAVKTARQNVEGGGTSKTQLNVRSGRLRSSITKQVLVSDNRCEGFIGSNMVYARIHEYGGVIRPKKGRMLAIPLRHNRMTGDMNVSGGVSRFSAVTNAGNARLKPSDIMYCSFIRKSMVSGKLFIWAKYGKGIGTVIPMFQLVPQVTIPKRPYLHPALAAVVPALTQDIIMTMESRVTSVKYGQ
jgi:phage gpG-like protein